MPKRTKFSQIQHSATNFGAVVSAAITDLGFRALVAPSFADIFANNCVKNGVLPVRLSEDDVSQIARRAEELAGYEITVDLDNARFAISTDYPQTSC
jgi:3-isopropylmalate/(R)-2-methylmalate dehydratase small subunit